MGITVTSRQLSETFQAFDGDMDGTVNYAEFCERVFPDAGHVTMAEKIHAVINHGETSKKLAEAEAEEAEAAAVAEGAGSSFREHAPSVEELASVAREASKKLHESRLTLADRFAHVAPQRLDVLEMNLGLIAAHLGVELVKYEAPQMEVDAQVKAAGARPKVKRASTSTGLSIRPIGHM